jgi:hypothetical protein
MPYNDAVATIKIPCVVYGLTGAHNSFTQVQSCTTCPSTHRRLIGPDCREIGMFNYNNKMIFTHELLDEYTSEYTTSEMPFTAWVAVVSRRYAGRHSPHAFVLEDVYWTVWFVSTSKPLKTICSALHVVQVRRLSSGTVSQSHSLIRIFNHPSSLPLCVTRTPLLVHLATSTNFKPFRSLRHGNY